MRQVIFMLLVTCAVSGCADPLSPPSSSPEKGKLRHDLFVECMELAAKMPRQSDDDVSDVVDSCHSHSSFMANSIMQ